MGAGRAGQRAASVGGRQNFSCPDAAEQAVFLAEARLRGRTSGRGRFGRRKDPMMEHLLISACLLGAQCRYDGQSKPVLEMVALSEQFDLVPLCPEQLGGLPTPRTPAERIGDRVITKDGRDVTAEYRRGAEQALHLARLCGCRIVLLKERSPSCGSGDDLRRDVLRRPDRGRRRHSGAPAGERHRGLWRERDRAPARRARTR